MTDTTPVLGTPPASPPPAIALLEAEVYVSDRSDAEEALILDPASLNPNLHYRFVQDRPNNVAKKKANGYRMVSRSKDGVKTLIQLEKTADDTIRHADMVLMCTTKAHYEKRRGNRRRLVHDRLEATHEQFKQRVRDAQRQGVKVKLVDEYDDSGPPDKEEE